MIRLLAIDIDGTLLDNSDLHPEANRRVVAAAIAGGVEVALATGRPYNFARTIFEQLPSPLTRILSDGAMVKTRSGETLPGRRSWPSATISTTSRCSSSPARRWSMGNGVAELKARGWAETETNDNEGVARAIETFIY